MAMKRQNSSRPGGGINSRVVVERPQRLGTPARGISPGAISQLGEAIGNHVTDGNSRLPYRGEKYLVGKTPAGGAVKLGNEIAGNVGKGGPGAGREVFKTGSQQGMPTTPQPPSGGRGILSDFGPDSAQVRNRK
jgi:hypothetical protein